MDGDNNDNDDGGDDDNIFFDTLPKANTCAYKRHSSLLTWH